jgi:2'-5' RNA ligase
VYCTIGVALAIPEPWGSTLTRQRRQVGDLMAEFIPPHVTLLGPTNVRLDEMPVIEAHLESVATAHLPFPLHLRGTGTFQPVTDVVYVVVEQGIGECEQVASTIRQGPLARELRYPYHPHVTIAHDIPQPQLDQALERLAEFEARFNVTGFTLFEHGEDGRWRPVRDFPFTRPAQA